MFTIQSNSIQTIKENIMTYFNGTLQEFTYLHEQGNRVHYSLPTGVTGKYPYTWLHYFNINYHNLPMILKHALAKPPS